MLSLWLTNDVIWRDDLLKCALDGISNKHDAKGHFFLSGGIRTESLSMGSKHAAKLATIPLDFQIRQLTFTLCCKTSLVSFWVLFQLFTQVPLLNKPSLYLTSYWTPICLGRELCFNAIQVDWGRCEWDLEPSPSFQLGTKRWIVWRRIHSDSTSAEVEAINFHFQLDCFNVALFWTCFVNILLMMLFSGLVWRYMKMFTNHWKASHLDKDHIIPWQVWSLNFRVLIIKYSYSIYVMPKKTQGLSAAACKLGTFLDAKYFPYWESFATKVQIFSLYFDGSSH